MLAAQGSFYLSTHYHNCFFFYCEMKELLCYLFRKVYIVYKDILMNFRPTTKLKQLMNRLVFFL